MKRYKHIPVIIFSGYTGVLTDQERKLFLDFDPVEIIDKPSTSSQIIAISKKLIDIQPKPFSFAESFSLELEDSIRQDPVLRLGFFVARKMLNTISCEVEISDPYISNKGIYHKFSLCFPMRIPTDENRMSFGHQEQVGWKYLKSLNDCFRHEIKNKLGTHEHHMSKLSFTRKSQELKEQIIVQNKKYLHSIYNALDEIKESFY